MSRIRTGGGRFNVTTLEPPHDDIIVVEVLPQYDTMSKLELMRCARERGLSTHGLKRDLIDRLEA